MENTTMTSLMAMWQDKIPAESAMILQDQLKNVPEDRTSPLMGIQLKSPMVGLILGLCFGFLGVDRFYKGDVVLGIVKLLIGWATLFIWPTIDLFLVWKGIKKDNLAKIQNLLLTLKS